MAARSQAPDAAASQSLKTPFSTAAEPLTQPESPAVSNESSTNPVTENAAGAKEPEMMEGTDTPPSTDSTAIETATSRTRQSPPKIMATNTMESSTQSAEVFIRKTALSSVTPVTKGGTESNEAPTTPAQLQTPPATAPPATEVTTSIATSVDSATEPAPANKTANPAAQRARKRALQAEDGAGDASESAAAPKPKRPRKKKGDVAPEDGSEAPKRPARPRKTTENGAAAEEEDNATPRTKRPLRRARSVTPEDAENQEADLSVLTMADLTRDLRIGKKFSRHDELLQQHREKRSKARERLKNRKTGTEDVPSENDTPAPTTNSVQNTPVPGPVPKPNSTGTAPPGPQFQIIDGQIVVDQNSLVFDRHAVAAANAGDILEVEEDDFTTLTTQNSYRTGSKLKGPNVWTEAETELFYRGLRMFGTDFQMISGMFPGKNRRHVKMKFNREERHAPARIDAVLVGKKELQIDLEEYKNWTKADYEPVEAIMAAQQQREAEFDAKQAEEKAYKDAINARKKALLEDSGKKDAAGDGDGGANKSRLQAVHAGPQIMVDADGMIVIDETSVDPDAGRKKRGAGKTQKKKAVEYNMRGEIIR